VLTVTGGGDYQLLADPLPALAGGFFLELHVFQFTVGKICLFRGGELLLVSLITGAFLITLGNEVRFFRLAVAAMLGQGDFQGMRGRTLQFRRKAHPENQDAMERHRQKNGEGETVGGGNRCRI
jgi:hypothetical protein